MPRLRFSRRRPRVLPVTSAEHRLVVQALEVYRVDLAVGISPTAAWDHVRKLVDHHLVPIVMADERKKG